MTPPTCVVHVQQSYLNVHDFFFLTYLGLEFKCRIIKQFCAVWHFFFLSASALRCRNDVFSLKGKSHMFRI